MIGGGLVKHIANAWAELTHRFDRLAKTLRRDEM